jgi:osmoprotectant transport system substrate-binding protein
MRLASTVEFLTRSDGLKPLQQAYGFDFVLGNVVGMDTGAIYNALGGWCRFRHGWTDLCFRLHHRDDRRFFPSYLLTPVIRDATLRRHPMLRTVLESLSARLENETMISLNAAIDLSGRKVEDVANQFLRSRALLP